MPMSQEERDAEDARALQAKIDALPSHLSAYRYQREIGGVTVSGVTIQTGRDTQAQLIGARIKAKEDESYEVNWKTDAGFVTLTAAQIIGIADAVAAHVQQCFNAEKTVLANIGDYTTEAEIETAFEAAYNGQ